MSYFTPIYEFLTSRSGVALLVALLLIAMWNMTRAPAGNLSQRLMRWRIALQLAAICLIIGVMLFRR